MMNMKSLSFLKGAPLGCFILSVILIGILVYNQVVPTSKLPEHPVQLVLPQKTDMLVYVADDDLKVSLAKGDSLSVLGYREPSSVHGPELLVETRDGQRGFISTIGLGFGHYMKSNDSFDTVQVLGIAGKESDHKVKVRYADGKTEDRGMSALVAILPDSISDWEYDDGGSYYMSKAKFERLYLGHTLEEASQLYRPYTTAQRTKEGLKVTFRQLKVFDSEKGRFTSPTLIYNDSLVATAYQMRSPVGNNGFFLKWWPLTEQIIDIDVLASLIQTPFYDHAVYGKDFTLAGGKSTFRGWLLAGVYIVLALVWLLCTPMLITLLMGAALQCRFTYYHLSDSLVQCLFAAVSIVTAFIWLTLMMVWGLLWWLAVPFIFVCWFGFLLAASPLDTLPHDRCLHCRRLYTMDYSEREWGEEYDQWEVVTEKGDLLHREHSSYETWKETTWSDGHKSTSDHKTHHVTDSTYAIHHYNVLFHYHLYNDIYVCRKCGGIEKLPGHTKEELQRTYLSSGTTTVTTET